MRANDLTGDSDIRNAGFCAQRERSRGAAYQQPFIGRQALGRPMLAPFLYRLGIGAERPGKVIADTGHDKRMRIGNRHQRQRTRIGALPRVRRHQPRLLGIELAYGGVGADDAMLAVVLYLAILGYLLDRLYLVGLHRAMSWHAFAH